jgi:hypothetical protein
MKMSYVHSVRKINTLLYSTLLTWKQVKKRLTQRSCEQQKSFDRTAPLDNFGNKGLIRNKQLKVTHLRFLANYRPTNSSHNRVTISLRKENTFTNVQTASNIQGAQAKSDSF